MRGALFRLLIVIAFAVSAALAAAEPAALTSCAAVRGLTPGEAARGLSVAVRGVVTLAYPGADEGMVVQDETEGVYVDRVRFGGGAPQGAPITAGTLVELRGVTTAGGFAPIIVAHELRVLGTAALPPATEVRVPDLLTGRWDCQRVAVRGVVQRAAASEGHELMRLGLATADGRVMVFSMAARGLVEEELVDAEVVVTAVCFTFFNQRAELIGARLLMQDAGGLRFEKLPPADPFSVPAVPLAELRSFSREGPSLHRSRTFGTVTFCQPGDFFYLEENERAIRVGTRSAEPLAPGDRVEVAGFADVVQHYAELRESVFRKVGRAPVPAALETTRESILDQHAKTGHRIGDMELDGRLVTLRGRVERLEPDATGPRLLFVTGDRLATATFAPETPAAALERFPRGSEVAVTGICVMQLAGAWPAQEFPEPVGFRLLPRGPADVRLLRAPAWWTTERLWTALAGTAAILIAAIAWAWLLRRRVAEQTRIIQQKVTGKTLGEERQRIARELHDTLEQQLAGVQFQIETLRGCLDDDDPEAALPALEAASAMLAHARTEARSSVFELRTQMLADSGLPGALRQLAAAHSPRVTLSLTGAERPLDRAREFHLLRCAQEAVANALRHAHAGRIAMTLDYAPEEVRLLVEDDGCGFDPAAAPGDPRPRFGLLGLRERVAKLRGRLDLSTQPDRGTQVRISVPAAPLGKHEKALA